MGAVRENKSTRVASLILRALIAVISVPCSVHVCSLSTAAKFGVSEMEVFAIE